jgi:type IV secretory pathway VirB10-like protein
MTDEAAPVTIAPKVDPETLAIRSRPARAIRLKRGAIVAIVAVGSVSLSTVAWMALRPHGLHHVIQPDDGTQPAGKVGSDALNGLPANYGDVPKLGPPLPGDLGKPILERQQSTLMADAGDGQRVDANAAAERERVLAEAKSARESAILVHGGSAEAAAGTPAAAAMEATTATTEASKLALDPAADPNGQQRKADFVTAQDKGGDTKPYRLVAAPSPYLLSAGSVIAASLITGLRSDLPGLVTAQVTENVYDSPTGQILLVPQGARLIGKYDSVVAFGQKRALVVWQRIILPGGSSISLDNMPATDPSGYAGLEDKVDFHTWQLLKGVAISTLLGIGADLQFSGNGGLIEAIRQSGQQNVSRAGDELTAKALDVQPTLTIRPGAPVRLIVDRDVILAPTGER